MHNSIIYSSVPGGTSQTLPWKDMPYGSVRVRPDLFWRSSRRGVGDRPGRLFPGPELRLLENINQDWEDVGVDDRLWSGTRQDQWRESGARG